MDYSPVLTQSENLSDHLVLIESEFTNLKILKGVAPDINEESMRVVKQMPRWSPGLMEDEPVNVQYNLPISYTMR
jgi:protein TonB